MEPVGHQIVCVRLRSLGGAQPQSEKGLTVDGPLATLLTRHFPSPCFISPHSETIYTA